ncbi:uncharacterized protein LOC108669914, partial [Hyalella azteca]|uniref:Uncharacterized protein LOC108669914 n=1 Tax=Hyalella azteca TaxID=294128 RepID=A0A979FWK8_HYAAZ
MKQTRVVHIELLVVLVLVLVPWPGSLPPRSPCPREKAALVRKVLEKRWLPVLERVRSRLPLECPLHPLRDVFAAHEAHKRQRNAQWQCACCGKTFRSEAHLDLHLATRHHDMINEQEDSVCLADYCDVMRCDVLLSKTSSMELPPPTALDVWTQHALALPSLLTCDHADDAGGANMDGDEGPGPEGDDGDTGGPIRGLGGPREAPLRPLHSWRDSCNEEHLAELRAKCQMLIQHCIAGLVLNLTLDQVRDVEASLQRSVCWYLTCERYWEAATVDHLAFPWSLVTSAVLLLTLGVSLAYYLVWGLADKTSSMELPPPTALDVWTQHALALPYHRPYH